MEKKVQFTVHFWVDSRDDVLPAMHLVNETGQLPENTTYVSEPIVDGNPFYDLWGN